MSRRMKFVKWTPYELEMFCGLIRDLSPIMPKTIRAAYSGEHATWWTASDKTRRIQLWQKFAKAVKRLDKHLEEFYNYDL